MKIVSIKIKSLIAIVLAVVFAVTSLVAVVGFKFVVASTRNGKVIVIDAGHGGIDGGVVGVSGSKESDVNLLITKMLRHMLANRGYEVRLTRSDANGLYDVTKPNKKLSDMQKRKQIINSSQADLVISIHQNSFPSSTVNGAQVFWCDNNENSESVAKIVQNALNENLNQHKTAKKEEYYVLQCSPIASVLIECGFLSNPIDEKNLLNALYRERLALIIANAIDDYFASLDSQSTDQGE